MTKSTKPVFAFALAVPLLLAGCAGADAQAKPSARATQVASIIEEVLRYGSQQFASKEGEAGSALCLAVREVGLPKDPSPSTMLRLSNKQAQPQSKCKAARTLIAGPIEWVGDDEVRVKAGYVRESQGETRLAYRVVREHGRWVCVGPIISWDPL